MRELLLVDDIEKVMNALVDKIGESFVMISEELGGWHHYLTTKKVSGLGSALGLGCLSHRIRRLNRKVLMGINFLEVNINRDDGFGIKIVEGGRISLTESTSYICLSLIMLLDKVKLDEHEAKVVNLITRLIGWLVKNRNPGEGWGPRKGYESRVFSTAITLISLEKALGTEIITEMSEQQLGDVSAGIKDIANWLVNAKNGDGGWGEMPNDQQSTAFHTSIAIVALKHTGIVCENKSVEKAKKWLLANWCSKYLWERAENTTNLTEIYDVSLGNHKWARAIWNHFPTPWAVVALSSIGEDLTILEVFKSIKWLLRQSEKGYIKRPTDPSLPIWAIWDALFCFDTCITASKRKLLCLSKPEQFLLRAVKYVFYVLAHFRGFVILSLYVLIGYFLVCMSLLSVENYFFGLLLPISFLFIERLIRWKK